MQHYLPLAPTAWCYLLIAFSARLLPRWPKFVSLFRLGATKPPSCVQSHRSPSPLHTLRILVVTSLTVIRLPVVSLYRSLLTAFLPLSALLPPRASTTSCLLSDALASPRSIWGTLCVPLLPSSTFSPKEPTSTNHTVISLGPPPCKTLPPPWVMILPVRAVSSVSPRPNLQI